MKLVILDTPALYYRAYYALPSTMRAPNGQPVNAAHGLVDLLAGIMTRTRSDRLLATWDDAWRPGFRTAVLPEYKAARVRADAPGETETPDDLAPQLPVIREVLEALGVPVLGAPGHEADDVIASLVHRADEAEGIVVVTGDRDLFQLLGPGVSALFPGKTMAQAALVEEGDLLERHGVTGARQYLEMAAMRGDTSDGLTGVPGIGEKTAASLLRGYGSLDAVLGAAREGSTLHGLTPRRAGLLLSNEEALRKTLQVMSVVTTLDVDVPGALPAPGATADALDALGETWRLSGPIGRFRAAAAALRGADS